STLGPADAHPHPEKFRAGKVGEKTLQTVVPPVAAARLDPDLAARQVQIVVDDDHVRGVDPIEAAGRTHRFPGKVHEGERLHQQNPLALHLRLAELRRELLSIEAGPELPRDLVDDQKSDVVPGLLVAGPRVSQSDEELQRQEAVAAPAPSVAVTTATV